MATPRAFFALLILGALAPWAESKKTIAEAPSPSSSTSAVCTSALVSLSGCLPYVQEGSTVAKPDSSCCSPLKKVLKEDAPCLCQAFKSSSSFGVSLNITKALSLPSACGFKSAPLSNCKLTAAGAPVGAPARAPGAAQAGGQVTPASAPSSSILHAPSYSTLFLIGTTMVVFCFIP
ncbi:Non-specific lipid-transfer protein-like protein [Apostasia shenzhenica]|uniref:Non-specific lipid-transfer protein-like protein n=1 Tax=Apostasia shenzhenica TaxID=1088818 RepID=A0A2I0AVA0_9ASPA|nr:Non-specific lipid-transfer protein-like protein [Apostasia shenzhenica]